MSLKQCREAFYEYTRQEPMFTHHLGDFVAGWQAARRADDDWQPINIIFDGPPAHESGRFVEVETDDGKSINAGEWINRGDGTWALRITNLPEPPTEDVK